MSDGRDHALAVGDVVISWGEDGRVVAKKKYRSFSEAREYVRRLGLRNTEEWKEYTKLGKNPANIPAGPWTIYKGKGWAGFLDWLGTGRGS